MLTPAEVLLAFFVIVTALATFPYRSVAEISRLFSDEKADSSLIRFRNRSGRLDPDAVTVSGVPLVVLAVITKGSSPNVAVAKSRTTAKQESDLECSSHMRAAPSTDVGIPAANCKKRP